MADCSCAATAGPDVTAANALCPNRAPPRVAHCVVGAARTFATDQAALSLLKHLVEDLGGQGLTSPLPDVFFHMKLVDDQPKAQKEWAFKRLDSRDPSPVCRRACRFAPQAVTLLNVSHSGPAAPAATARCFRSGFWANDHNRARAVSQWNGFAACHAMVAAREAAVGLAYDTVVIVRPDLVWYQGVRPYCLHDLSRTTIHRGKANWDSKLEWLIIMPRRQAASLMTTARLFETCAPGEPCCAIARSEDLLEYALRRAGEFQEVPFAIDILRAPQEAARRNAGCSQPDALGFRSFAHCREVMYGLRPSSEAAPASGHRGGRGSGRGSGHGSGRGGGRGDGLVPRGRPAHRPLAERTDRTRARRATAQAAAATPTATRAAPPPSRTETSTDTLDAGAAPSTGVEAADDSWVALPLGEAADSGIGNPAGAGAGCDGLEPPMVAVVLAGPVRSLLKPAVHLTIKARFWDAFGGRHVLFARLFDTAESEAATLRCVVGRLAAPGGGQWSQPQGPGRAMPAASETSGCRYASGTQLARYPYMSQSLSRQLRTLASCYAAVVRYEREHGATFAYVLRTRTDTAFLRPALPFCRVDAKAVLLARAWQKGDSGHHMFADHAAIVPRAHTEAFFDGVRRKLERCARQGDALPAEYDAPESFLYHALVEQAVPVASPEWLAPLVVSVDGRMPKWCGRYEKLRAPELLQRRFASTAACARWFLADEWSDGNLTTGGGASCGAGAAATRRRPTAAIGATRPQATRPSPDRAGPPKSCTIANGCCKRHPRMPQCLLGRG